MVTQPDLIFSRINLLILARTRLFAPGCLPQISKTGHAEADYGTLRRGKGGPFCIQIMRGLRVPWWQSLFVVLEH